MAKGYALGRQRYERAIIDSNDNSGHGEYKRDDVFGLTSREGGENWT